MVNEQGRITSDDEFWGMEQASTKRVMIVDDESDVLMVVEQMLQELNVEIDSFTDATMALQSFQINPNGYSLIISDLRMPQMSGLDFIYNIRQLNGTVRILVMSAFEPSRQEIESARIQLKVNEIISKPFSFIQFVNIVRKNLTP